MIEGNQNFGDEVTNTPQEALNTASNIAGAAKAASGLGDLAKNIGKEGAKELGKEGLKAAASTGLHVAAGVATGGTSEIVMAAIKAGSMVFKGLSSSEEDKKNNNFGIVLVILILAIICLLGVFDTLFLKLVPSGAQEYKGSTFEKTYRKNFGYVASKDTINFKRSYSSDDVYEDYYYKLPFETAIQRLIYNTTEENLDIVDEGDELREDNGERIKLKTNTFLSPKEKNTSENGTSGDSNKEFESLRLALASTVLDVMYKEFCGWSKWSEDLVGTGFEETGGYIEIEGTNALEAAGKGEIEYYGDRTIMSFLSNHYPYDLKESEDSDFPCIGNVLRKDAWLDTYSRRYNPKLNDVNYAEVLGVISQNEKYDWDDIDFKDYLELINSKRSKYHYFEMIVPSWVACYYGEERIDENTVKSESEEISYGSASEMANSPLTKVKNGITMDFVGWYATVKVKPFGLREEYMLAEADPYALHNDFKITSPESGEPAIEGYEDEEISHNNSQILDYEEMYFRTYERTDSREVGRFKKKTRLGPSYAEPRNKLSAIYNEIAEWYGEAKGRNGWYYYENPYNIQKLQEYKVGEDEYQAIFDEITKNIKEKQVSYSSSKITLQDINIDLDSLSPKELGLLEFLVNAVGCEYSQANRWAENIYDCSSLAIRAFESVGISLTGGLFGNTETLLRKYENTEYFNTTGDLQFGSIILYSGNNEHYKGVGHVSIYIGNGEIIQATGSKKGVQKKAVRKDSIIGIINMPLK